MNLTQETDTMLYAPDTVLVIECFAIGTSIDHPQLNTNSFSVSPNYPNPFSGQTQIDVFIEHAGNILIRIYDLSGREHASYEGVFDAGRHTFTFYPGNENFYIFSATYDGLTRSTKIANPLSVQKECEITYKACEKQAIKPKDHPLSYFHMHKDDNLRYIGYSRAPDLRRGSDVIEDAPHADTSYMFDITIGITCADVPTVFHYFKDYNTVQIGTQCWFKENLNVGTLILGIEEMTDNGIKEKYCYQNLEWKCDNYGGLYQWDEVMDYSTQIGAQGFCPVGWHIPTDEEFKQLEGAVDSQYDYPDPEWDTLDYRGYDVGKRLKSKITWNNPNLGNDYFGFSALATGARHWEGWFANMGIYTSFWSSVEINSSESWYRYTESGLIKVARYPRIQSIGRSVRCLKDE